MSSEGTVKTENLTQNASGSKDLITKVNEQYLTEQPKRAKNAKLMQENKNSDPETQRVKT